ncbi:hypothetical protein ACROYT_G004869 [Oculina patagonica]
MMVELLIKGHFHDQVKKVELATGKKIGLSFILPHSLPESNSQEPATQHPDNDVNILQKWKLVSPDKVHPMSIGDISLKAERLKKRLFKAASERNEIEKETRDQHTSVLWYNIRQPRITASQCKRCLLREATSPTKAISEVFMYKPIIQTRLMKEGIEMEPKIIEQFSKETGNVVRKCGFFLSETHSFLEAIPDGITERGCLVEVKKETALQQHFFSGYLDSKDVASLEIVDPFTKELIEVWCRLNFNRSPPSLSLMPIWYNSLVRIEAGVAGSDGYLVAPYIKKSLFGESEMKKYPLALLKLMTRYAEDLIWANKISSSEAVLNFIIQLTEGRTDVSYLRKG